MTSPCIQFCGSDDFLAVLRYQEAIQAEIRAQAPRRNVAAEQANRDRILKRFHETEFAGELLPNGKILYDCREMTPEQWERARFRTS